MSKSKRVKAIERVQKQHGAKWQEECARRGIAIRHNRPPVVPRYESRWERKARALFALQGKQLPKDWAKTRSVW
jgi:hypothetical protein